MTDPRDSDAQWRRSEYCGTAACVEVARVDGLYLVRDSKNPQGATLSFNHAEWRAFEQGMIAGNFRFE
jgi:hypothetical protein